MQIVELYFIGLFYIVSKIKSPCKLGICLFTKNLRICTSSVHSALEIMQLAQYYDAIITWKEFWNSLLNITQELEISKSTLFFLSLKVNQFSSVTQSCLILCDPMDCSMPGLPVHHHTFRLTPKYLEVSLPTLTRFSRKWLFIVIKKKSILSHICQLKEY